MASSGLFCETDANLHAAAEEPNRNRDFFLSSNQVEKTAESMKGMFTDIQTVEILMRNVLVRRGRTRPGSRMIGHTAFLTTGRKTVG